MNRIEPTRKLALKVWWAFLWRAAAGAVAGGFVIGVLLGFAARFTGMGPRAVENIAGFLGLAIGLGVSVEMMYRVLRKRFKDFEIALVARGE